MKGGKALGIVLLLGLALAAILTVRHNAQLEQERAQAIAQLVSMPQYENCRYDASTCPQAEEVAMPPVGMIAGALIVLLLGAYLIRSDATQRRILDELQQKRAQLSRDERRELLMSVLTQDERKVVLAVLEQPGISQATLRLRTDMSKAKLSMLLKDLEGRGIISKVEDGKTNAVHLKREI